MQKGGPLSGPKRGLLSNTRKWTVQGDTHADKARDLIGKGCLGREQEGRATQENCFATWLTFSGFRVMRLISGLSLANHSDTESFLAMHASVQPRWKPSRRNLRGGRTQGVSFDLSLTLSMGGGLVPYWDLLSKNNPDAWPGWEVSVSVFPLTKAEINEMKVEQFRKSWNKKEILFKKSVKLIKLYLASLTKIKREKI